MITFIEHNSPSYVARTLVNAAADCTIAFALDFNSAGEQCTANAVKNMSKTLIKIDLRSLIVSEERVRKTCEKLNALNKKEVSLNIAGNGIYTLYRKQPFGPKGVNQKVLDSFVYQFIASVVTSPTLNCKIVSICSGGQTGADEAGAKAGNVLGIPTKIVAPKGWKFRDATGVDISNEQLFKARFL